MKNFCAWDRICAPLRVPTSASIFFHSLPQSCKPGQDLTYPAGIFRAMLWSTFRLSWSLRLGNQSFFEFFVSNSNFIMIQINTVLSNFLQSYPTYPIPHQKFSIIYLQHTLTPIQPLHSLTYSTCHYIILAMQSKSQIKERLTEIRLQRQAYDRKFDTLHRLLTDTKSSRVPVHRLRADFQKLIPQLRDIVRNSLAELETLKQACKRLQLEGQQMQSTFRTVDSLREYFQELQQKVKTQQMKGQQRLSERQRWELTQGGEGDVADEEARLMVAAGNARETRQMAGEVLASLQSQTGRLQGARQRMSNVLKNINLSGNLLQLIRSRSREDNRLILLLSIGLLVQAFVCVYFIRPLVRGG